LTHLTQPARYFFELIITVCEGCETQDEVSSASIIFSQLRGVNIVYFEAASESSHFKPGP
jgi:hypothetical protein